MIVNLCFVLRNVSLGETLLEKKQPAIVFDGMEILPYIVKIAFSAKSPPMLDL